MSLISKFNHVQFEWIPREQNKEADRLMHIQKLYTYNDNSNLLGERSYSKTESLFL